MDLVYDVAHNIAKVERHKVNGKGTSDVVVHRKGATRAFLQAWNKCQARGASASQYQYRLNGHCEL